MSTIILAHQPLVVYKGMDLSPRYVRHDMDLKRQISVSFVTARSSLVAVLKYNILDVVLGNKMNIFCFYRLLRSCSPNKYEGCFQEQSLHILDLLLDP